MTLKDCVQFILGWGFFLAGLYLFVKLVKFLWYL